MKGLFGFLGLVLASAVAFATPKVGDTATFQGLYEGSGGGSMDFMQTLTVKAISADFVTVDSIIEFDGQARSQEVQLKHDELLSNEVIEAVMTECEVHGGTLEVVSVPAGDIETCGIVQGPEAKIWLARVPFGIAKQIALDEVENIITLQLKSFQFGK